MSERQKTNKFLKSIIQCDNSEPCQQLQERIRRAEKEEQCVRSALFLVIVLGLLSLSGIAYAAVLVPEFAHFSSHIATKICCALGLACFLCAMVFLVFWLHQRAATNRVYAECRHFVHGLVNSRMGPTQVPATLLTIDTGTTRMYQIKTPKSQDGAPLLEKAS